MNQLKQFIKPKVMNECGNRREIPLILVFGKVFHQFIFYISNSFSSYEVISDHQRTVAPECHWREQIQDLHLQ